MRRLSFAALALTCACSSDGGDRPDVPPADAASDTVTSDIDVDVEVGAVDADAAPSDAADVTDAATALPPGERGPFGVAVLDTEWTDTERDRTLPVTVWYPTEAEDGDPFTYQIAIPGGLSYAQPSGALDGAEAAVGAYPVIVFSHGNSSFRAQSYFLTEHLATRGFVVVAADHVGNDTATYDEDEWVASAIERPRDVSALIDAAEAWNDDASHPLTGRFDLERVGVAGHSYGGFTVFASLGASYDMLPIVAQCESLGEDGWDDEWAFCDRITSARTTEAEACSPCDAGDARIDAALAMAPAFAEFFEQGAVASIEVPVLVMAGTLDDPWSPAYAEAGYVSQLSHEDSRLWALEGGSHYSFSNACDVPLLASLPLFGCTDDVVGPGEGFEQIRAEATLFFESHL